LRDRPRSSRRVETPAEDASRVHHLITAPVSARSSLAITRMLPHDAGDSQPDGRLRSRAVV